jgi:hypothetical protein
MYINEFASTNPAYSNTVGRTIEAISIYLKI